MSSPAPPTLPRPRVSVPHSPYLLACSTLLPVDDPRCAPIPHCLRASRPRHRAAMSAAHSFAAGSSVAAASSAAEVVSLSPDNVGPNDLLIVGPGVLGRIVASMWKQEHPGCRIFGQTATTDHHSELTEIGIIPSLKGSLAGPKFPYVIFCAPPYRTDDYPQDLRVAASNWNGEGSFLFTSSTAVYECSDNGLCNEPRLAALFTVAGWRPQSVAWQPVVGDQTLPKSRNLPTIKLVIRQEPASVDSPCVSIGQNPRTDVLLKAENVVLEAGGCVLRLVGLYKSDRGPHIFWLSKGTVDARPDHILNLIHCEDAASLAIAIMKTRLRGRIFVGCDNQPLSRQEIMDLVNRSGKFDTKFEGFTGTDGPLGKRMENSKTRAEIGWQPKYPNFAEFLGLSNL